MKMKEVAKKMKMMMNQKLAIALLPIKLMGSSNRDPLI
jgi:hypothetical protein